MALRPCDSCARHVRASETACPFCGGAIARGAGGTVPDAGRALSRAAVVFFGATTLAACVGGPGDNTSSSSTSSSGTSGSSSSGSSGTSGNTSGSSSSSSGTSGDPDPDPSPAPAYGPAPIQDGG